MFVITSMKNTYILLQTCRMTLVVKEVKLIYVLSSTLSNNSSTTLFLYLSVENFRIITQIIWRNMYKMSSNGEITYEIVYCFQYWLLFPQRNTVRRHSGHSLLHHVLHVSYGWETETTLGDIFFILWPSPASYVGPAKFLECKCRISSYILYKKLNLILHIWYYFHNLIVYYCLFNSVGNILRANGTLVPEQGFGININC